jgi:hypothetical protein
LAAMRHQEFPILGNAGQLAHLQLYFPIKVCIKKVKIYTGYWWNFREILWRRSSRGLEMQF